MEFAEVAEVAGVTTVAEAAEVAEAAVAEPKAAADPAPRESDEWRVMVVRQSCRRS